MSFRCIKAFMHAFSGRFSRTCLEGISFNFFVCFIFNVSLGSAPKRKNFDIQRNTRVASGGQFTLNYHTPSLMHSGFRICIWKVGTTNFWPCFGRPKLGECDKMGSVSKIISRWKKQIRPQFSKYRLQIESAWAQRLWAHADSFWKRYFENCGRIYFFWRLILVDFFFENRVNFGRP